MCGARPAWFDREFVKITTEMKSQGPSRPCQRSHRADSRWAICSDIREQIRTASSSTCDAPCTSCDMLHEPKRMQLSECPSSAGVACSSQASVDATLRTRASVGGPGPSRVDDGRRGWRQLGDARTSICLFAPGETYDYGGRCLAWLGRKGGRRRVEPAPIRQLMPTLRRPVRHWPPNALNTPRSPTPFSAQSPQAPAQAVWLIVRASRRVFLPRGGM